MRIERHKINLTVLRAQVALDHGPPEAVRARVDELEAAIGDVPPLGEVLVIQDPCDPVWASRDAVETYAEQQLGVSLDLDVADGARPVVVITMGWVVVDALIMTPMQRGGAA